MARAWHGRAVARGRVASGRAESCKCTDLRVGSIGALHAQGSHVILVTHMYLFIYFVYLLFIYLFVYLFICLFIYLFCLFIYLFVYLFVLLLSILFTI